MGTYIAIGYILDQIFGDPGWLPNPLKLINRISSVVKGMISGRNFSAKAAKTADLARTIIIAALTYLLIWFILYLAKAFSPWLYGVLCSIFIFYCLSVRSLGDKAKKIMLELVAGNLALARQGLASITDRQTNGLNEGEIIKGTVGAVTKNTVAGVVAPFFYIFIGGPALGMAYMAINAEYKEKNSTSNKLADLANWLPTRIAAFLILIVGGVWGKHTAEGMKIHSRDKNKQEGLNAGQAESAMAGVLGVRLGGPEKLEGQVINKPFLGDAKKPLEDEDILDAVRIMQTTAFLCLVIFYLIAMKFGFR